MDLSLGRAQSMTPIQRRGRRLIEVVGIRLALPAAILAIVFSPIACAQSAERSASSKGAFEAKIEYCQDCHGPSGQGFRGFYPIPRLAGQHPDYLKNQLQAFVDRGRPNAFMTPVAHTLSPAMITALAARFAEFNPRPLDGAPRRLAAEGEKIFQDGVPEADVPACAACHGPQAQGHEQVARLAGQLYPYIVKALTNWSSERGQNPAKPDNSAFMKPVAHSLTKHQIEAVAAYVSNLR